MTYSFISTANWPDVGGLFVTIIAWFVQITSSVAAGVVLFTLMLKLITLPFDYISRASTRKNSIKMEEMRPELEKLQKQYADNKDLYNQKMMALYKKNGYSMFGACLPTIITLVIFFIAIAGFNDYSRYQNLKYFRDMASSYNQVLYNGLDADGEYIIRKADGSIDVDVTKLFESLEITDQTAVGEKKSLEIKDGDTVKHEIFVEVCQGTDKTFKRISTTNSYVFYDYYSMDESGNKTVYYFTNASVEANLIKNTSLKANGKTYAEFDENYEKYKTSLKEDQTPLSKHDYFIKEMQREASAKSFNENGSAFLWVKNIWVTDSAFAHPIESLNDFNSKYGHKEGGSCSCSSPSPVMSEETYNELTNKLGNKKTEPNGYFILVILTAGISLLTQFVMGKSQKAQMELQTVDGQGAQTQKIMMWMMPIMMAVFAFMYTAAFSIYIVLSSLISMLSTFGINKIVDLKYKKKDGEENKKITHSRVYTPKEEPADEQPKKAKKNKKKGEENKADFLSGEADKKKHIRGRLK